MKLLLGDCLDKLKELDDNSVDSIVTDPPYGLSFMGKKWDYDVPSKEIWEECMRVLKPGGHLLAFAGSRTYHRMAVRIEDAGFEIRDQIMWIYGSGFPKSMNIGLQLDKKLDNERVVVGKDKAGAEFNKVKGFGKTTIKDDGEATTEWNVTKGNTEWEGWGTALKPAHEPIVMARKPFKGGVAENVLEWGTGGINIDASRIEEDNRFPANFIHGGIEEDWARYFYCPKASKKDRDEGLDEMESKSIKGRDEGQDKTSIAYKARPTERKNNHPTVKPTDLMLYLIRLVTPKDGITLDPFMGSGSTGKAAIKGGFDFIGIEREQEYFDIAKARIDHENNNLFKK